MIAGIQAMFLTYGPKMKNGKKHKKGVRNGAQVAVRPIQLWEIVFPKEHMNMMLKTIGYPPCNDWRNIYFAGLRKMLKADKIPSDIDMTKVSQHPLRGRQFAGFDPIGMRRDKIWPKLDAKGNPNMFAGYEQL